MKKYLPVLRQAEFFHDLSDADILTVLGCVDAQILKKQAGDYILHAGDTTVYMGLILTGSVLIVQEDLWGHRNVMAKSTVGDFFAEPFAATPNTPLNINVIANEDCTLLMLNTRRLLTVCPSACDHHNKIVRNLVSVLANRILLFNDKITHMSKRTIREKLLSYLSNESIRQGSLSFDIPFDRQQLADFLCVERSAMSAELSKLKTEGILDTNKTHFILHSEAQNL